MRKIDRFDKYMAIKGLNDNKVTNQLNLSVGRLGKSRKTNRDLSDDVVELILKFYTDLNRVWLLTGEGEMLVSNNGICIEQTSSNSIEMYKVPLFPLNAVGGTLVGFAENPEKLQDCDMTFSPIEGADLAVSIYGDSMYPAYPSGCRVFVKRIDPSSYIPWGSVFVLDTSNGIIIKQVKPSEKENFIKCHSLNPNGEFTDFNVPLKDIRGMFKVLGCMTAQW